MVTMLITGADGVIGSEVVRLIDKTAGCEHEVVPLTRRAGEGAARVRWNIGQEPAPVRLRRHWDVIVHLAASTRWTMTRAEAEQANVRSTAAVVGLADRETHLVYVSTAYVGGHRTAEDLISDEFDGFRNGYEWSKAQAEALVVDRHVGPRTIIRPPLVLGRRTDGAIARFSGPYTLLQALVSGLAAVVVGSPDGYAEMASVDDIAQCVVAAAFGSPASPDPVVIAGGRSSLRLSELLSITVEVLNDWRAGHGIAPLAAPPIVPTSRWRRFYLPLARRELSEIQNRAVDLLSMFESYTSMRQPFTPTHPVVNPAEVLRRSVRWWAEAKPRLASRVPEPWAMIGEDATATLR